MTQDREKMILANSRNQKVEERLSKLEYMMQVSDAKPKVFEDIYDNMASIREQMKLQDSTLQQRVDFMQIKINEMRDIVDECSRLTQFLNGKSDSFDQLMSEQRVAIALINDRMVTELTDTKNEFDDKFKDLKSDIKKVDTVVLQNSIKVREFADIIDRIEAFQRDQNRELCALGKKVIAIKETKVEQTLFEESMKEIKDQVMTIKYATQDNFRSLLSTDNYLEKYLPFFIQGMISESMNVVLKPEYVKRLKDFEHSKYREWHKTVLNDSGIPTLQKRGFKLPGQQQVVNNNNMDFIQELGEHVVSLEWFLSRDTKPVSPPSRSSSSSSLASHPPSKNLQQTLNIDRAVHSSGQQRIQFNNSARGRSQQSRVQSSKGMTTPMVQGRRQTAAQHISERGLDKLKVDYLMGVEDLEPELAEMVQGSAQRVDICESEIDRLKKEYDNLKDKLTFLVKEEVSKFKQEVKSAFVEHLEFIQEIHKEIESEQNTRRKERNSMELQIQELQAKFNHPQGIHTAQEQQKDVRATPSKDMLQNAIDSMKLQNILNHEIFKVLFLPKVGQMHEPQQTNTLHKIRINDEALKMPASITQRAELRKTRVYSSNNSNRMHSTQRQTLEDFQPNLTKVDARSDTTYITNMEVNTVASNNQEQRIDCYKIIQMIDSLIKGTQSPNISTIAEKVQHHQQRLKIKHLRQSFASEAATPHNEMMVTGLTSLERFEEAQYIKSGNTSMRREDLLMSLNSSQNEFMQTQKIRQKSSNGYRLGSQFLIRQPNRQLMSPKNQNCTQTIQ